MNSENNGGEWRVLFPREAESFPDDDIGLDVALLLAHIPTWTIRRVEKIRFVDDRTVRRQVSVDFTLPLDEPLSDRYENSYLIPLGLLRKAPLVGFDLRDEAGTAVPVLSRRENSLIAWSAAVAMGQRILGHPPADALSNVIRDIVSSDPAAALAALDSMRASEDPDFRALISTPAFTELLDDLAKNFLLLTPVPFHRGRRRIMKFSYLEAVHLETFTLAQRLGLESAPIKFALPAVDDAESFHLEVDAPAGMDVFEAQIVEVDEDGNEVSELAYEGDRGGRSHLYPSDIEAGATAEARIWLLPVTRGFVRASLFFAIAVTAMLVSLLFVSPEEGERSGPTLLLALPGVVGLFISKPGENAMTSRLLLGLRGIVSLVGFLPFVGAVLLVLDIGSHIRDRLWIGLTIAAAVALIVIARAYVVSRQP
ncbi:MAG: hypothetical protein M3323_11905 [Actinomycetota bacterium]|nr:hypothetical protein [Actinomycetota bacterium]